MVVHCFGGFPNIGITKELAKLRLFQPLENLMKAKKGFFLTYIDIYQNDPLVKPDFMVMVRNPSSPTAPA